MDEAGCGALAGPVVAAAVLFSSEAEAVSIDGLNDSKRIDAAERERIYAALSESGADIAVARVEAREIDRMNILQAALEAMARAAMRLAAPPSALLVDGNRSPAHRFPHNPPRIETVVKGDALSLSIAAASIAAKVERDRMMERLDVRYPQYGFARHKGYPTRAHKEAIALHGASPIHRRAFKGVREHLADADSDE